MPIRSLDGSSQRECGGRPPLRRRGSAQPSGCASPLALCAFVLSAAFLTPAGAQSEMKRVTDANNRFSIAFPARWTVESIQQNTRILATEVPISSLPQGSSSRSAMVGTGPGGDFNVPPRLVVVPLDLPRPVTPEDISTYVQQNSTPNPNFQMTQNGFATIAGQHAFYMYGVGRDPGQSTSQYAVLVYIAQGREGFLMVGSTLNDPDRIKRDFTAISQILETFRIIPQHGLVNGSGTTAIAFPSHRPDRARESLAASIAAHSPAASPPERG